MANDNRCNAAIKKEEKKISWGTPKNVREIFMEHTKISAAIFRLLS